MSVSGKAVDRHDAMADRYATEVERYLSKIEAVLEDGILTGTELEELRDSLDRMVHQKKRPIFGALPYKNLSYPAREPGSASANLVWVRFTNAPSSAVCWPTLPRLPCKC